MIRPAATVVSDLNLRKLDFSCIYHLDLIPGGGTQVGDKNFGAWLGTSDH